MNPSIGFIPMATWAYDLFLSGEKDTEFRVHGGRFVAKHYPVGRLVVISAGYGKGQRSLARVRSFAVLDQPPDPVQWERVYGAFAFGSQVAAIGLDILDRVEDPAPPHGLQLAHLGWVPFDKLEAVLAKPRPEPLPPEVVECPACHHRESLWVRSRMTYPDIPCPGCGQFKLSEFPTVPR